MTLNSKRIPAKPPIIRSEFKQFLANSVMQDRTSPESRVPAKEKDFVVIHAAYTRAGA